MMSSATVSSLQAPRRVWLCLDQGGAAVSDLREPFRLRDGWLLWAGIGFGGAVAAIALTGATAAFFSGENPQRDVGSLPLLLLLPHRPLRLPHCSSLFQTDALVQLLPLIGSSATR